MTNYFNDDDYKLLEQFIYFGDVHLAEGLLRQKQMTQEMLKKIFFYIFNFRPSFGNSIASKILIYQQIDEVILQKYISSIVINNRLTISLLSNQKLSTKFILKNLDYYKQYISYIIRYQSVNVGLAKQLIKEINLFLDAMGSDLQGIDTKKYYFNVALYNEITK